MHLFNINYSLTPNDLFAFVVGYLLLKVLCFAWIKSRPNRYHRYTRKQADKSLLKIRGIANQNPDKALCYLRKIHPHVLEELVLSAAENAGFKVRRNKAYTSDGGVDGQILIGYEWYLVQTKRYSSAINAIHVTRFSELCNKQKQPGLFVHTGRTGRKSHINKSATVYFISGQKLIDLVLGKNLADAENRGNGAIAK